MRQPLPVFGSRFTDAAVMAKILSVEPRAITETGLPMEVVSCGVPFLFVPLRSLQDVRNIQFRHDIWKHALRGFAAPQVFVFTRETETSAANVHCRMFAPVLGNFVFVDYWADENELHHHVYVSPSDKPEALEYVTPTGLVAYVWDLRAMWFERQAWVEAVLANPIGPDVEQYLLRWLNDDA